jgi:hypothetical protein
MTSDAFAKGTGRKAADLALFAHTAVTKGDDIG